MTLFAVKALLAPGLVVAASFAGRRFGAQIAGVIGGLPVVAGPILLIFALDHGREFTSTAAASALLGLACLTLFICVYALLAANWSWAICLLTGWAAFTTAALLAGLVKPPLAVNAAAAFGGVVTALFVLPRSPVKKTGSPPSWDLIARGLAAAALVLTLSALAGALGPRLSGVFTPFPIIATVLAVFTHINHSVPETYLVLRGLAAGLFAFGAFFLTLALLLPEATIAVSFVTAAGVALAVQTVVFLVIRSRLATPTATT